VRAVEETSSPRAASHLAWLPADRVGACEAGVTGAGTSGTAPLGALLPAGRRPQAAAQAALRTRARSGGRVQPSQSHHTPWTILGR